MSQPTNPATVTVVTSPAGIGVGPVAAYLGRDLGDGLAIRTVDPRHVWRHTSPAPSHTPARVGRKSLHLGCLPSAWQNPDTNLGVAFARWAGNFGLHFHEQFRDDIATMDRLGLHPGHRLTVHGMPPALAIPAGEPGDLGAQARDAVLRAAAGSSRHVLVEAGDGQTFLDALHTVGLAPWSPHIEVLDLWLVVDAATSYMAHAMSGADLMPQHGGPRPFTGTVQAEVARQGGGANTAGERLGALRLAALNVHTIIPELAGVDSATFTRYPGDAGGGDIVPEAVADRLGAWLAVVERAVGARIDLVSTGTDAHGMPIFIDLRPADPMG